MTIATTRILSPEIAVENSHSFSISISLKYFLTILLLFAVMISAMAIVYVTDLNRHQFSELQNLQLARNDLNTQYGQLLLERNTWAAPARVQQIAQNKLNMILPDPQSVVVVSQ